MSLMEFFEVIETLSDLTNDRSMADLRQLDPSNGADYDIGLGAKAVKDSIKGICSPNRLCRQIDLKTVYKADYSKYEPFILPHKTKLKMLYCTLTGTELNRIPKQVEAHVNGKRFRSKKAEFEERSKREAKGEEQTAEEGSDEHDFWAPSGGDDAGKGDDIILDMSESESDGDDDDDSDDSTEEEDKAKDVEQLPSRTAKQSRNKKGGVQRRKGGGCAGAAEKKEKEDRARNTGKTDADVTAFGVGPAGGMKHGAKPGKKRGKHRGGASDAGVERHPEAKEMSVATKKGKGRSESSSLVVGPLSDETPAISNALKTASAVAMASKKENKTGEAALHVKKEKEMICNKTKQGKGEKGRSESATGNGAAPQERKKLKPNGGLAFVSTTSSSLKRRQRIPEEQASVGKKKRMV